jgi:hypothetical protein
MKTRRVRQSRADGPSGLDARFMVGGHAKTRRREGGGRRCAASSMCEPAGTTACVQPEFMEGDRRFYPFAGSPFTFRSSQ